MAKRNSSPVQFQGMYFYPFPDFGCYVAVLDETVTEPIFTLPAMDASRDPDLSAMVAVTAPESAFLSAVNAFWGTTFTLNQFYGR